MPVVTADAIAKYQGKLVLIERKKRPFGLALPGGKLEEGESLEKTVVRELLEETGLSATKVEQLRTYSEPDRDPRGRYITTVYVCETTGHPIAKSDAKKIVLVDPEEVRKIPRERFAFDHYRILMDYLGEQE